MLEEKIVKYKQLKTEIESKSDTLSDLRESIIGEMKERGIEKFECQEGTATLSYPKSFDKLLCKQTYPKQYEMFVKREEVTEIRENFDEKEFKKKFKQLYDVCSLSKSDRLTIK